MHIRSNPAPAGFQKIKSGATLAFIPLPTIVEHHVFGSSVRPSVRPSVRASVRPLTPIPRDVISSLSRETECNMTLIFTTCPEAAYDVQDNTRIKWIMKLQPINLLVSNDVNVQRHTFLYDVASRLTCWTCCRFYYVRFIEQIFQFNLFIKQKDRSATYIDMHEIHVEKL